MQCVCVFVCVFTCEACLNKSKCSPVKQKNHSISKLKQLQKLVSNISLIAAGVKVIKSARLDNKVNTKPQTLIMANCVNVYSGELTVFTGGNFPS